MFESQNFIGLKITRSPERAAVYHARWIAWDPRGDLLRGTDSCNASVRGSAHEHGPHREKRTGSAAGSLWAFARADIESFERDVGKQEVIRRLLPRTSGSF